VPRCASGDVGDAVALHAQPPSPGSPSVVLVPHSWLGETSILHCGRMVGAQAYPSMFVGWASDAPSGQGGSAAGLPRAMAGKRRPEVPMLAALARWAIDGRASVACALVSGTRRSAEWAVAAFFPVANSFHHPTCVHDLPIATTVPPCNPRTAP